MSTSCSPRSRIPVRTSSCPQSPKPRHLRLLHSGLITIPENPRQSSADAVLTRMPRVKSSDGLYKSMTDKVLPQLPQPEIVPDIDPQTTVTPTIRKVSNGTIEEESVEDAIEVKSPTPEETMSYADSVWQEYHIQDAKLTRWTLSTNLQATMDQTKAHLTGIATARTEHNCLISLLKGISETDKRLELHCQRTINQHQAMAQKETQLCNASDYVIEHNDVLITKCRDFLTDTTNSYHTLQIACEKTLVHAKESSISQQGKQVPKRDDLCKKLDSLETMNKDIETVIENIIAINGLLDSHKHSIDVQVANLNHEIIKLASKRGSSVLRKMLCFR